MGNVKSFVSGPATDLLTVRGFGFLTEIGLGMVALESS